MYSNLRYYGGSNHYLVPTSVLNDDVIYGGGLVQIIESTSEALNRRLAYMKSEDVFPPNVLSDIRLASNATLPVQFFPLCMSNPHSRNLLAGDYKLSNPLGSKNFLPFVIPMSELRRALDEEDDTDASFVVKFVDAGTSDNLRTVTEMPQEIVVLRGKKACDVVLASTGKPVSDCSGHRVPDYLLSPEVHNGPLEWFVSKLLIPYPQFVGMPEEICMS
jgi:hypothetical protein